MASTIWKGHLTFGLVSIPIKLFRAARPEKIHMHRLERSTGARVRQVFVPASVEREVEPELEPAPIARTVSGPSLVAARREPKAEAREPEAKPADLAPSELAPSQVVKGYEFEKDRYVAFEPGELDLIAPKTSPDMQIVEFVRFAEVDPIYLESSYYVAADKGGEKPYALLFEALKKTGYAAIAEFVMHRRDQVMILRPGQEGVIAHTLFYEDEVKRENAFHADSSLVAPREMELAVKLVDALAATFDPAKFKDKYRERLQSAISAKIETGAFSEMPAVAKQAPVVDILAALKESLSKAKKPAASEVAAEKKKRSASRA